MSATTPSLGVPYRLRDTTGVSTPALAVYPALIAEHLQDTLDLAPRPEQLRPHVKTHKTRELVELQLAAGITKHKCATLREAELLADVGVPDILVAYTLVGPNLARFCRLQRDYPDCSLALLADHPRPIEELSQWAGSTGQTPRVLLDLDLGMGRTGVGIGPAALELYRRIAHAPGLIAGGLHVYDGNNHQSDPAERAEAVGQVWHKVAAFRTALESAGLEVPALVCGNSATYPAWCRIARAEPRLECSPGTFFLNDANYFDWFADIPFAPAAVLLTRVVSKPRPGRLTLDLGYKAVASDAPLERRVRLLDLPDARIVLQNEEHLVVETERANDYSPGDLLYAWPAHICPTCALHRELLVVEEGRVTGSWQVAARDR